MDNLNIISQRHASLDEINNNTDIITKSRCITLLNSLNPVMAPTSPVVSEESKLAPYTHSSSSDTAANSSSIQYGHYSPPANTMSTHHHVFRDNSRLAQRKANTKIKRTRKPYQVTQQQRDNFKRHRCNFNNSPLSRSRPGYYSTKSADQISGASCGTLPPSDCNYSNNTAPASLFYDDWSFQIRSAEANRNLSRTRSCEDLRQLAKTTTVSFDRQKQSLENESTQSNAAAVEDVSSVFSGLRVEDPM